MAIGNVMSVSKIPVVQFSRENLKPGTYSWLQACQTIRQALEDHGCFILEDTDVSVQLQDSVLSVIEDLFGAPRETKLNDDKPIEAFNINHAETIEDCQNFTSLVWPDGNKRFCQTAHAYAKAIAELEKMITRMVFESYGLQKYYDSHTASTTYLLRFLKYNKPEEVDPVGHTDGSFMTVINQNDVKGLQVKTKDGEWCTFEPSPRCFMIMAGDAFAAWSNGRIKACQHRVALAEEASAVRYSFGVFSYQKETTETPEEFAGEPLMQQSKQELRDLLNLMPEFKNMLDLNALSLPHYDNNGEFILLKLIRLLKRKSSSLSHGDSDDKSSV